MDKWEITIDKEVVLVSARDKTCDMSYTLREYKNISSSSIGNNPDYVHLYIENYSAHRDAI
jgi:hypothetical protein